MSLVIPDALYADLVHERDHIEFMARIEDGLHDDADPLGLNSPYFNMKILEGYIFKHPNRMPGLLASHHTTTFEIKQETLTTELDGTNIEFIFYHIPGIRLFSFGWSTESKNKARTLTGGSAFYLIFN